MKSMRLVLLATALVILAGPAFSQTGMPPGQIPGGVRNGNGRAGPAPPPFVVMTVHLDDTMAPKNELQTLQECLDDDTCKSVVDSLGESTTGVDPSQVTARAA